MDDGKNENSVTSKSTINQRFKVKNMNYAGTPNNGKNDVDVCYDNTTRIIFRQKQQKPQVPPKPQLDAVRYSMANVKDELDLEVVLSELLELENQLSSNSDTDQWIFGLPTLLSTNTPRSEIPSSSKELESAPSIEHKLPEIQCNSRKQLKNNNLSVVESLLCASPDADSAFGDASSTSSNSSASVTAANSNVDHRQKFVNSAVENLPTDAFPAHTDFKSSPNVTPILMSNIYEPEFGCRSPSMTSYLDSQDTAMQIEKCSNTHNDNNKLSNFKLLSPSSSTAFSAIKNSTISSTVLPSSSESRCEISQIKAEKIREALQKMKEANMKKIYAKIFLEDGSTRGLLIDERWTVAETMRQLAHKLNISVTTNHAIIEENPELLIRRIYEDHEFVVENIEEWMPDSKNKLHFIQTQEKYNFFCEPQLYFLKNYDEINSSIKGNCEAEDYSLPPSFKTTNMIDNDTETCKEFNGNTMFGTTLPLEGWLMLKVDGKKSWRKHYFVLRSSGLYYYPKCGKAWRGATKDLQCLMSVYNNQVYVGQNWKKYKAPTEFGFAIKHPKIQVKTSKYIKYICADTDLTLQRWMAALRITRNGFRKLYQNYAGNEKTNRSRVPLQSVSTTIKADEPFVLTECFSSMNNGNKLPLLNDNNAHWLTATEKKNCDNNNVVSFIDKSPKTFYTQKEMIEDVKEKPSHIIFDQEQYGTIKKHPFGVTLVNNCVQQDGENNHNVNELSNNHLLASVELSSVNSANIKANDICVEDEFDSDEDDEDQFPPPPIQLIEQQYFNNSNAINSLSSTSRTSNQSVTQPRKKLPPPPPPRRSDAMKTEDH